ncbi:S1 family peptidase [Tenacibaculum agarivorans]|uniref:S1 family peptidase n=1 Tax=Tenacibaculum agarivorans TaxID=1908389 RepID=UPI0009F8C36C|nr:serine protease [Tenacibaculum agarivorans]
MKRTIIFVILFGLNALIIAQQKGAVPVSKKEIKKKGEFIPIYENSKQLEKAVSNEVFVKQLQEKVNYETSKKVTQEEYYRMVQEFLKKEKSTKNKIKFQFFQEKRIQDQKQKEVEEQESGIPKIIVDDEYESEDQIVYPDDVEERVIVTASIVIDSIFEDAGFEDTLERNKLKKIIKGPTQYDSRIEIEDLNPVEDKYAKMLFISESVAIVIDKRKLKKIGNDYYKLDDSITLQGKYNLCDNVPFGNQHTIGIGTAFIVGEETMLTAAHVFQGKLKNYAIVFNYKLISSSGIDETIIHKSDIYYPKKIVKKSYNLDVLAFDVDRSFAELPLAIENSKVLAENQEVYMIGHPLGLPKKAAINARILDNSPMKYFYTSLDAFQGNSGSPVLDVDTHKVIGVLVSGERDYVFNGNCYEDNICRIPYCKGEKVVRIEAFFGKQQRK